MHTPPALYFFPQAPDLTGIQHAPMPHIHHSPPAHHRHHTHLTGIQRSADATHTSLTSNTPPTPHTPHRHPTQRRCHTYITHLQHTTDTHTPHRHPAQRRCHTSPVRPQGNSALAAIQRSADGPPPPVRPLNPHTTKKIPHSKHPLSRKYSPQYYKYP